MNKIERFVYNLVRSNPLLKVKIRNLYQAIFDIAPLPPAKSSYPIVERPGYFYGFHDHSPFSSDNSMLLANHALFDLRMPALSDKLTVGFFDGENHKTFNKLAQTSAWSWHIGCKLQWVGSTNEVIFNDHVNGCNIARVIDVDTRQERILSGSIGSVSPDGSWGVGYSFARVEQCMPGYGYKQSVKEIDLDVLEPSLTGLYRVDIKTGAKTDILSIEKLASTSPSSSMKNTKHYVTHTIISPDSNRFIFLHRWIDPDGPVDKRFSRLVVADFEGNVIDIFRTDEMVSHISWKDSAHVLAYCRVPVFDDKFVLFKIGSPDSSVIIGKATLSSDGHPSYDSLNRWIVTDAYPDRRRVQNLIIFDTLRNIRYDVAKLPQPKEFQSPSHHMHWGCDLHPRWDRKSSMVCFDATFSGKRSLCTMNFGGDILDEKLKYLTSIGEF